MGTEFTSEQFSRAYPEGIEHTYWNRARNRVILRYAKRFKIESILDVGCGKGIVTSFLFNSGIDITGVDMGAPSQSGTGSCKIYYNTAAGNLPAELRNKIQIISLFDVIEHIENPREFLEQIVEGFPNLKYLLITVPGRNELWSNFDDYYGHYRRYTLESIGKEMGDCGFKIIFSRYFFHILYPLIRMNNMILKNRDLNIRAPKNRISLIIHKAASALFYLELFIIPGFIRGSSIIAVCAKIKN